MIGIYGGSPVEPGSNFKLADFGINAVFVSSRRLSAELVEKVHLDGGQIFAEFNSMHLASFLEEHPDAYPIGADGEISPPQEGWQGICPTHPGYRENRMDDFRRTLTQFEIDGVWLDYHHAHASWERP